MENIVSQVISVLAQHTGWAVSGAHAQQRSTAAIIRLVRGRGAKVVVLTRFLSPIFHTKVILNVQENGRLRRTRNREVSCVFINC